MSLGIDLPFFHRVANADEEATTVHQIMQSCRDHGLDGARLLLDGLLHSRLPPFFGPCQHLIDGLALTDTHTSLEILHLIQRVSFNSTEQILHSEICDASLVDVIDASFQIDLALDAFSSVLARRPVGIGFLTGDCAVSQLIWNLGCSFLFNFVDLENMFLQRDFLILTGVLTDGVGGIDDVGELFILPGEFFVIFFTIASAGFKAGPGVLMDKQIWYVCWTIISFLS